MTPPALRVAMRLIAAAILLVALAGPAAAQSPSNTTTTPPPAVTSPPSPPVSAPVNVAKLPEQLCLDYGPALASASLKSPTA